jgi:hypothetical protein
MSTARYSPDALLTQANLTGAVAAIQDDPDSPDASWLTTTSGGHATLRASFPTPANNVQGTQEFKALVRLATGGSNSVTAELRIAENNLVRGSSATTTINASGTTMLTLSWNSSVLTNRSGTDVEVIVEQLSGGTGGSPSTRRYLEIGAIEWNADIADRRVTIIQ